MIDPLSALSIAASVVQFVEFGSKILETGYEAYRSTHGATEERVDLEELIRGLYEFQSQLATPAVTNGPQSTEQRAIEQLASRCCVLADKLLSLLEDLKVKGEGLLRTWDSFRQGCRSVWKKEEISKLEKLLRSIGDQINSRVLQMLRQDTSMIGIQLRGLNAVCDQLKVDLRTGLKEAQDALKNRLEEQSRAIKSMNSWQVTQAPIDMAKQTYFHSLETIPGHIDDLIVEGAKVATSGQILKSLLYDEFGVREEQIQDTFSNTFEWIFEDHASPFKQWLASSSDVFWISGKAGSGKSTLMKFLSKHEQTTRVLHAWAGDQKLIFACFFFWSSGSAIQKSQLGLMQSLLLQILRQCPELIPFASPQRWEADEFSESLVSRWSRAELSSAIKNILERGRLTSRFCFFIDGLDEYADEHLGDHHTLIQDFDRLARTSQVKFCVSSRPWTVFKDRYEKHENLKLVLQDLTSEDMYQYVNGILASDKRFKLLVEREPKALDLVAQIRDRAEGVFLWVFLVVRSLLRGLGEHDDTEELQQRLSDIPSDLDAYFRKIVSNVEPVYRDAAMRAFQLATISVPMPLAVFWYISEELRDPDYAIRDDIKPLRQAKIDTANERARIRVNKWCRDLLEVRRCPNQWPDEDDDEQILFLHRTVKDFLLSREMHEIFATYPACRNSSRQAVCKIYLALSKAFSGCTTAREFKTFESYAQTTMLYAKEVEVFEETTPYAILVALGETRQLVQQRAAGADSRKYWSEHPSHILHYAVRNNLLLFVGQLLDRVPDLKAGVLQYATSNRIQEDGRTLRDCELSLPMINLLLEKGVDSNDAWTLGGVKNQTAWQQLLVVCYADTPNFNLFRFAEPLLRHGADVAAAVELKVEGGVRRGSVRPLKLRYRTLDVRTCLIGRMSERDKKRSDLIDAERNVDRWLSEARARQTAENPRSLVRRFTAGLLGG